MNILLLYKYNSVLLKEGVYIPYCFVRRISVI